MAAGYIPVSLQLLWSIWNIRGFMIISLTVQLVLALTAPLRQKTSNFVVISIVWLAYFLADWTAIFTFGLISNAGCSKSPSHLEVSNDLLSLWASFLLIHLGGPDTITAFLLEDNALWLRHLFGLIAQVLAFFYIFAKTLPENKLMATTILVFAAGVIKYGERTRALYLASLDNFKESLIKFPYRSDGVDLDRSGQDEEGNLANMLKRVFHFFQIFKGLIVNIMPNHSQRLESREFFFKLDADSAFKMMAIELTLLYEVFYTKIMAASSNWGMVIRSIAYYLIVAAFVFFYINKKEETHSTDIWITYALFAGVSAVNVLGGTMVVYSYWNSNTFKYFGLMIIIRRLFPLLITKLSYILGVMPLKVRGCCHVIERLWPYEMGSFNLLVYSFEEGRPRKGCVSSRCCGAIIDYITEKIGIAEAIAKFRYTSKVNMDNDIWKFMFETLKEIASHPENVNKIHTARGELALQNSSNELQWFVTEFEYDQSVILWHIATEICYNTERNMDKNNEYVRFSKFLSDYMIYLLVKQPDMMSAWAVIFHKRYRDICGELKRFEERVKVENFDEFCSKGFEEYKHCLLAAENNDGDAGATMLIDSCSLASTLLRTERKWEVILRVWMELLFYAAGHCRVDSHARLLNKGGEFVTFVWLSMAHLGIGPHFEISRAKLPSPGVLDS